MQSFIINRDVELGLAFHDDLGEFDRVDPKIADKFRLRGNVVGIDAEFIDK